MQFAEVSRRLYPEKSGSEWLECAGVHAVFNGADSPITQTFGLGLNVEWNETALDKIERFFLDRKSPVHHEVSPFAELMHSTCSAGATTAPSRSPMCSTRPLAGRQTHRGGPSLCASSLQKKRSYGLK